MHDRCFTRLRLRGQLYLADPREIAGPCGHRRSRRRRPGAGGARKAASQTCRHPVHPAGHIAFVCGGLLFCGDTLFSAGCGRLFEGTAEQMHASLSRLAALPEATRMYCGHEYTEANLRFALAVEPDNADTLAYRERARALRTQNLPTLPSTIGLERRINPFFRTGQAQVRRVAEKQAGRALASEVEVFAVVRRWKDSFRG